GLDFGAVFVSYQRRKKKPKLFADLVVFLKEKGIEPSQCVVVDDLHAQAAQREYGFIPVTFDGTTQDVSVLRESLSAIFCGP
ncbi:MAG: hypothetical protein U1C57_02790, partial [Candidatus Doudnabacteria bacterium]|nr:hypothetical protein [Candidatus Doudnabacteria bacterium]